MAVPNTIDDIKEFEDIWPLVQRQLKASVKEIAYSLWLEPLEFVGFDNNTVTLRVDAEFRRKTVLENFSTLLRDTVEDIFGFPVDVQIILKGEEKIEETGELDSATINAINKYNYTFENFVTGSSNKFAHAAALNVANNPGNHYNPLFIYGNSGLGKTHLLCAIQRQILKNNPNANIIYTSGELFTNELIHFISIKDTHTFHEKYRNVDVLLVDDIQFIAKTVSTQEEFFHTFDYLIQQGKQVVLTSDRPPKEMVTLEERLRNRFEWGLMADIQPPTLELRMAIVKLKCEEIGIELDDDIIKFIAESIKKNVRQLEGIIKRIEAFKNLYFIPPALFMVQEMMQDLIDNEEINPVTVDNIIDAVSECFGVPSADIKSDKRSANVVQARQITMYIIHDMMCLSLQEIGTAFGKHHTTVMHALKEIEGKMSKNVTLRAKVDDIKKNLYDKYNLEMIES